MQTRPNLAQIARWNSVTPNAGVFVRKRTKTALCYFTYGRFDTVYHCLGAQKSLLQWGGGFAEGEDGGDFRKEMLGPCLRWMRRARIAQTIVFLHRTP